ncbi:hypothetical protein GJ496_004119 [Pomphorhynchus laevis]|nr:hypothetical protein GJ496_004119 [Pomphorhynchus laevis]
MRYKSTYTSANRRKSLRHLTRTSYLILVNITESKSHDSQERVNHDVGSAREVFASMFSIEESNSASKIYVKLLLRIIKIFQERPKSLNVVLSLHASLCRCFWSIFMESSIILLPFNKESGTPVKNLTPIISWMCCTNIFGLRKSDKQTH